MAYSKETGLECLVHLNEVYIKQTKAGFGGNKYIVMAPNNKVLYEMKEDSSILNAFMKSEDQGFKIKAVDSQNRTVFDLRRPRSQWSDKVQVFINGSLVSTVRKEQTMLKPLFSINDAKETPVLRIKGGSTDENFFKLQTVNKNDIGSISKKFGGLFKELFSDKDNYVITFPANLHVSSKAAVIAACILIDYRYHG